MSIKLQTTKVFQDLLNPDYRNYVFQGSSRAGKTYNIVLWLVINILNQENKVYSIVRKTLPSLKGSVLRDLKEILLKLNLYDSNKWHSVDGYVEIGSNIIEFFSLDTEEKIRGRKRDICFINEATEITYDEYVQLSLRTSERMILDFNPSLWKSWLYDLEKQDDTFYTITTYKDNVFLPQQQVEEIEKLRTRDSNLWRVFGLGQKGIPTRVVFNHQQYYEELPKEAKLLGYGIDFGFSDPNTLVRVYKHEDSIYCEELLYLRNTTISDFIYKIKDLKINLTDDFICDSANPQAISEMSRSGINAKPVKKDTILSGIDQIKRSNFFVHKNSKNLIEELNSYVWKSDKNGNNLDEPEDRNNHILDPIRYILQMKVMRNTGVYVM
jgi:phage terminase large subunit